MSSTESLADAIAITLRQTPLAPAAVDPMARTLAALADDLTAFDKAADAQLKTIEIPSAAARSLLLGAIKSLARFTNLYVLLLPIVRAAAKGGFFPFLSSNSRNSSHGALESAGDGPALRLPPVQVRPFSSTSGSGNTTWQVLVGEDSIVQPPQMQCSTGHLFIHRNPKTRVQTCWMYGKDGRWELANEDTCHPLYPDRVLHFRQNEEPSWWTRASKMTARARTDRRTASPSA